MNHKIILIAILATWLTSSTTFARIAVSDTATKKKVLPPVPKFFVGTAMDGAIFSSAIIQKNSTTSPGATTNATGTVRFSGFLNAGFTYNFNFGRHFGVYFGTDIKNIGFIETNSGDETVKRRSYNIGAPVGVKIGNMAVKRPYVFFGGGVDVPINYKEKTFVIRDQKTKITAWFSSRTPTVMTYVFAGFAINRGLTFKMQYYPGNFLNPNFTVNNLQPYAGYDVHLVLFSLGMAVPVKKQQDIMKKEVTHLDTI